MLKIDQYAYINRLSHVHPAEKMVLALATMFVCLAFPSPVVSFLVILLMTGLIVWQAGIPFRFYFKLMLVPLGFLLIGVLAVAVNLAKDATSFFWGIQVGSCTLGVSRQGLMLSAMLLTKSLAAVSCLYFLSLTTPMVEIFAMCRRLRLPPLLVELMSLVYRYIFVLLETAEKIYISQTSRGGYTNLKTTYVSMGQLISNLFSKSWHTSKVLYLALLSRCYTGELSVLERPYHMSPKRMLLIITTELVLLMVGLGWRVLQGGGGS
ncbi:MAG TPA: cobalt ECF transporter T component CbiQ [Peptococcaceae bacterium]|nr:cobalt ECF transporter T component CbiQ [Peptococcaceae bacterium]